MRTTTHAATSYREKLKAQPRTYGGGFGAKGDTPLAHLWRLTACCLLWEDQYYQSGTAQAKELAAACAAVSPVELAVVAIEARNEFKLRHVPLFLASQLEKRREMAPGLVRQVLAEVIQRPDELAEFLAIHAKVNGRKTGDLKKFLSAQVKKGLADAYTKFSPHQLAKWNRDRDVKLRDVLFLCHAKPRDGEQAATWKALVEGDLAAPDTWEVALSAGADKQATWTRLLSDDRLGDMAFLMNLRNMTQAKVDRALIRESMAARSFDRVLPFRFISAAKHAPDFEPDLDKAMQRTMAGAERLAGRTLLVVDISGSMGATLSGKSELSRVDAACALAILVRGISDDATIYATAGNDWSRKHATAKVPARSGMALKDAIKGLNATLGGGGVFLYQVTSFLKKEEGDTFDRVIVITDEQDCDNTSERAPSRAIPLGRFNYIMNVGAYDVGLDTKATWTKINGFSERVLDFVRWHEQAAGQAQ